MIKTGDASDNIASDINDHDDINITKMTLILIFSLIEFISMQHIILSFQSAIIRTPNHIKLYCINCSIASVYYYMWSYQANYITKYVLLSLNFAIHLYSIIFGFHISIVSMWFDVIRLVKCIINIAWLNSCSEAHWPSFCCQTVILY